jgi:hypothetical protein
MGATESLLLMELFHLMSYFSPISNANNTEPCKHTIFNDLFAVLLFGYETTL